jgi:flagellar biosynthesis/type III secretory pathway M-ring protein FliF/YscJ
MSSGGIFILVLLVLFLVWLMLVRPQRRRQRNQELMIDHLRVGDEGADRRRVLRDGGEDRRGRGDRGALARAEARLSKRAIAVVDAGRR